MSKRHLLRELTRTYKDHVPIHTYTGVRGGEWWAIFSQIQRFIKHQSM